MRVSSVEEEAQLPVEVAIIDRDIVVSSEITKS